MFSSSQGQPCVSARHAGRLAVASWRRALQAGLAVAALLAAGQAMSQTAIVIGGALKFDNDAVWKRIVDEAGGPGSRFAVFATAAGNPERSSRQIIQALARQGAQAEFIPVAPRLKGVDWQAQLQDPQWAARVRASQAVFFSGGAQELIVDTLQPRGQRSALLQAIWDVYQRGGVVAGTSAGAAIMSTVMFRDAQDVMQVLRGRMREGQEIDRGLGFVGPALFIDQHFLKRGRIGRMLPLMVAKGYQLGLGVEENSAAIVKGDMIEVIGARGVLLADLRQARSEAVNGQFALQGALLSYLERGDRHDLRTGETWPSEPKRASLPIDPAAEDFKPTYPPQPFYMDMLGDGTIAQAMAQLVDGAGQEVRGLAFDGRPHPQTGELGTGFEFRLYKGPGSKAWFTGAFGGEDYTVVNVRLDVRPVRVAQPLYQPVQQPIHQPLDQSLPERGGPPISPTPKH